LGHFACPRAYALRIESELIFVVKKEDDNLKHLLNLFTGRYPNLKQKSVLIIDDEADLASVSFRKTNGG